MKNIFAGIAIIAAVYFATAYNVEIKINENYAAAQCSPNDPGCD